MPPLNPSFKEVSSQSFTADKLAYLFLGITLFLLPFFFIPSRFFSIETSKSILLVLGVILTLFLFLLNVVKRGEFEFPKHKVFLGVLVVPIAFLLSAIFSTNPSYSLFGYGLEAGSWAFVTVGFIILFLTAVLIRSKERIFYSYLSFLVGAILVLLVALVKVFFGGEVLTLGVLQGITASPVGSWTDLAAFLGASLVMIVVALETVPLSKLLKTLLYGIFVSSLFVLSALNFSMVWLLLLIFSLVFFVYVASAENLDVSGNRERRISYSALILLIVSIVFFFNPTISGTNTIGGTVANMFGISNIEIRPSFSATRQIAEATLSERPIFGSGPNTFGTEWLKYKPLGVNSTDFWNLTFPSGFGLLPTFVATSGLAGTLAWILFLVFYVKLGVKAVFSEVKERWPKFILNSSFLASLFFWIMCFVYVPSVAIFALTFFFSGLFIAAALSENIISLKVVSFGHNAKLSFVAILILIAVLLGNVVFAYSSLTKSISSTYFLKALAQANESNNVDSAITNLNRAVSLANHDIYYRVLSQAYIAKINDLLVDGTLSNEERSTLFQNYLRSSITASQSAINSNPTNYENWVGLGRIYESLIAEPFSIEGSYESAVNAYKEALARNPQSPEMFLLLARLEVVNGDNTAARNYIEESLAKKNNYADAYFLLTQLELNENNITKAIESAERAAILSPNNSGVFFQLGLLKYNNKDYEGAREALAYATSLVPNYANAKYFLGLSLEELDRHEEAIGQFEDLVKSNPDNEEVALILANLKADRNPLNQIPSSISNPATRPTPPISDVAR